MLGAAASRFATNRPGQYHRICDILCMEGQHHHDRPSMDSALHGKIALLLRTLLAEEGEISALSEQKPQIDANALDVGELTSSP